MQVSYNYPVETLAAIERNPFAVALSSGTQTLTNGQVAVLARLYARHMMARGVTPFSCVILAFKSWPTAFLAALAANLIGARWVDYHRSLPLQALGTTHFFHGKERPEGFTHPGTFEIDANWTREPEGWPTKAPGDVTGFASPDDPAFVSRSSGTTGTPKFLLRTCSQVGRLVNRDDLSAYRCIATLFPLVSSAGFRMGLTGMLSGIRVVLPARLEGEAADMQRAGVDYVAGSPSQVDALCRGVASLSPRIGTLRVGGSIMGPEAVRHWLRYFERVTLAYGAREGVGGGTITLTDIDDDTEIAYALRPEIDVEILAEDGALCPPAVPGIVRVRSPMLAKGYIGDPEATAEVFRGGWFYPGDIGMLTPEGRLKILGRVKDQFNLGGVKFNAADVDLAAKSVPGIVDAMCFSTPGITGLDELRLCAIKHPDRAAAAAAADIRAACAARTNRSILVTAVHFVDALPLNDNGKPVRSEGPRIVAGSVAF